MSNEQNSKKRERVILTPLGLMPTIESPLEFWEEWPSNEFLRNTLHPYRHLIRKGQKQEEEDHEEDWQIQARRALLEECGFLPENSSKRNETMTVDDAIRVQTIWDQVIQQAAEAEILMNDTNIETMSTPKNCDLIEFFKEGGKSNHRQLEWALMDCAPGCQFQLHAHPNLELVYCIKGALHEVRLLEVDNLDLVRDFEVTGKITSNNNPQVIGPSLMNSSSRPWRFDTLSQGHWLVNRVGTIHKSFTATKGDGCILLVLWGGSHANISQEPSVVRDAVEAMDRKLGRVDYSCTSSCRGKS